MRVLWLAALVGGCCWSIVSNTWAGPPVNTDSPIGFFTNVAAPLLKAQLGLDLTNIHVFPTNQYSPAVHRLLQVTANLYDATTNRVFATSPAEPYCPTVFRPLFRRTPDGAIIIAGFREVNGTTMASVMTAPPMVEPDTDSGQVNLVPPLGAPFRNDSQEPMISGVPLVIGARKGFPNFNEFAMQTAMSVSRLLEFRRAAGDTYGPVMQTNQMYVAGISNTFGLEAWYSYSNAYPRNLQLLVSGTMTALITNEFGDLLLSNRVARGATVTTNNWSGWTSLGDLAGSFMLPFGTANQVIFLTNSSYVAGSPGFFAPQTHIFAQNQGSYVPHWYLILNTRALCILVDTDANRIVDYVNLNNWEPTLDVMGKLTEGADCSGNPAALGDVANQWCTNLTARGVPIGVINQIQLGLGLNGTTLPNINSFSLDPYSAPDAESAVDGFRYNLNGWGPIYPNDQGKTFYKSNVFYVPFDPDTSIYIHTSWQANDPLVHYTLDDLLDLRVSRTNRVDFVSHNPPLDNLGQINNRYQPWGGGPSGFGNPSIPPTQIAAKDPLVTRSDCWDFPTNQPLGIGWVGQVHRGTPWQTIFLKSSNILLQTANVSQNLAAWQTWTGNPWLWANWQGSGQPVPDAVFTLPTNDWRLVSQLVSVFNTNDLRTLTSANQTTVQAWTTLLDGLTVLTNPSPGELDPIVMSSTSPQAAVIATGLLAARSSRPGQVFLDPADILATPELSVGSPWLNGSVTASDEAFEMLPAQLLAKLRPDSIGSVSTGGGQPQLQFTGFDGYPYAVQVSSNLVD
ncbi:MAG TPA: hypothetical protein VNZ64_07200 [Candidatus Acidoferrum sp.]|nr:hypothetical protein [Candidatus Acidoferrum sp.]